MRVLVDTSVWSLALRRAQPSDRTDSAELHRLIRDHLVEIIGPIRQEILSGIREPSQFEQLERFLAAFPDAPVLTGDYVMAAKFFKLCRSKGIQGSNTDFLICAVAARSDFMVFTADHDFGLYAVCLPVTLHQVAGETGHRGSLQRKQGRSC